MLISLRLINFLIANLFITIYVTEARPPSDRILNNLKQKPNRTKPSRVDCGNVLMLIDKQADLFKCLLQEYIDDEIVFPDSVEDTSDEDIFKPIPTIRGTPKCAKIGGGGTYCEEIDNYPYKQVQMALRNSSLKSLFYVDVAPDAFVNRIDMDGDRPLCEEQQRLVFPKIGQTTENIWKYIINTDKDSEHVQGIVVKNCRDLNKPCEFATFIPPIYVSSCKQQYITRRLLSISTLGTTTEEIFKFPYGCCCYYRRESKHKFPISLD